MLRPLIPRTARAVKTQQRSLHHMPLLQSGIGEKDGVPGLFSGPGFSMGWTRYQGFLLDKLNRSTVGTDYANKNTLEVLTAHARRPEAAAIFNYASMAHNNHLFYSALSPVEVPIPGVLQQELAQSFSSIETLKQEIVGTGAAMFGPGFVWLVINSRRKYSILTTYLAGTPYPEAHYRHQPVDMNTEDKSVAEAVRRMARQPISNTVGAHGQYAQSQTLAPGAEKLTPVLCVSTWEHTYQFDYGVSWLQSTNQDGQQQVVEAKVEYLNRWWDRINWNVVAERARAGEPRHFS